MAEDNEGVDVQKIYNDADRVMMMKLLLDNTEYAQASKEWLQEILESIKAKGHIEEYEDVFFHFFREIFRTSKTRLDPDFDENSSGIYRITLTEPLRLGSEGHEVMGLFRIILAHLILLTRA
ncbi:hypothetical protein N0V91_003314 [Didymella pomorum]|uniref:Uncharacterized protein n=1 Tax=Didymella pomorum TaxID=749634 RepID=A0A9W9D8N7_9PLEO|nr:hypothetical protein N0V91_003314 [Didymella pomorum]